VLLVKMIGTPGMVYPTAQQADRDGQAMLLSSPTSLGSRCNFQVRPPLAVAATTPLARDTPVARQLALVGHAMAVRGPITCGTVGDFQV
jgi:hypothetical protein